MRRRFWILTVVCLLAVTATWLLWPRGGEPVAVPKAGTATSPVAAVSSPTNTSATAKKFSQLATGTNRFAFRLSNTKKTLTQLTRDSHAVLLQNAFLDTSLSLTGLDIPAKLKSDQNPGAYIVQARGPINSSFRTLLTAAGAQVVSYIPNNAYLVQATAGVASVLSHNSLVQAVLPYEPYYKLQPSLLGLAVEDQPLPPGTILALGMYANSATTESQIQSMGGKVIGTDKSPFGPVLYVLAPENWTALVQLPMVQVVQPMYHRKVANDLSRVALGISTDTVTPTNYLNLNGNNVMVEVNDTGIDPLHPDFALNGSPSNSPSGGSRVFGDTAFSLLDTSGHGTHVAGIIAGNGAESLTLTNPPPGSVTNADFRGKAPMATLYSVGGIVGGHDPLAISDRYFQEAPARTNALISNNSWVYAGDFDYDLASASYDAATRDALPTTTGSQPVLFVFPAGNDGGGNDDGSGGDADTIHSPGTAKNVITVGALEQPRNITNYVTLPVAGSTNTTQVQYWQGATDSGSQVAAYSSRGNVGINTEGTFGRFKPDVVAPGNFVVSTSSEQWDTNAYYNPTNVASTFYSSQVLTTNGLNYYTVSVPPNAVGVTITITTNQLSIAPFPNLTLYAQLLNFPDPINAPNSIDITTTNGSISIPPGGGAITLQSIQNNGFTFAVGDTNIAVNSAAVNYDLTVTIATTNGLGDYYQVLAELNAALAPWYHYESGTSIAAPAVSGVLALMQDYFTNTLQQQPSPALLKAMLINGSRSIGGYAYAVTNGNNFEGWGQPSIVNSLPLTLGAKPLAPGNLSGTNAPIFLVDQSPTNALATGDSHTYFINIDTDPGDFAQYLNLQATLVWTDPPGDPNAAIKLVNNLDLVITNLDTGDVNYGAVYFGNDISSGGYNLPWSTNSTPNLDTINNVENIVVPPLLGGHYSITVIGRDVNVNAVTAQANNVVQDYALVVSVGEGEVPGAITSVTDNGIFTNNSTTDQQITAITSTNTPLFNQFVGANSPFVGTNTLPLGTNTIWGSDGQLTVGVTNQWHFYVVKNTGPALDYTNAVFATFNPLDLSIPRMGVYEEADPNNATRPEADIDLYATTDPGLTNLSSVTISNCLAGVGDNRAAVGQGGTEFVYFTDSTPGQVYYIGVKSEDQMASEYDFLPLFTDTPLSSMDQHGNQIANGQLVPMPIPDGTPSNPGITNVFAFAIMPMTVEKVSVANLNEHQNFGDLVGTLSFNGSVPVVLNNHDGMGNTFGTPALVYDDSAHPVLGSRHSDGPGSLVNYRTKTTPAILMLNEVDNSHTQTGQVSQFNLTIQPHRDLQFPGIFVDVPPGGWFVDYISVPPGYTNLTFNATNFPPTIGPPSLLMFEKFNSEPTLTSFDQAAGLTNCSSGVYPTGTAPGNSISVGPPLVAGDYFIAIYNPSTVDATNVFISATLGIDLSANVNYNYNSTSGSLVLTPDAVTVSPNIFVGATQLINSVNVGMVVKSPQISDYTFTLVSPTGQRVLLMENRGGSDTNGAGSTFTYSNILNTTASGGFDPKITYFDTGQTYGNIPISYNFYDVGDEMTVYYGTNISSANLLLDTGMTNGSRTVYINYPGTAPLSPPSTFLTIIMNQFGNYNSTNYPSDAWDFTAGINVTNYEYLTFTEDSNLTTVPIKFAVPPFGFTAVSSNYTLSDFELATNGIYQGSNNIPDAFGGWTVPTNVVTYTTILTNAQLQVVTNIFILTNNYVSVVTDPVNSLVIGSSNYLALADGTITRSIATTPGKIYNVTFWFRGPGIASWWRGEGNASDSSDPENDGNNGILVGRFNFPAGEVGQAFQFQDGGDEFDFAGTNTYVQIPQSPSLNVGKGGGFTVEGWINPTNLGQQQPVLEWLAHVPTNSAVTNIVIQAGPYWNPATSHYYYMLGSTDWITSEQWAVAMGGHLATIDTANEQTWVFDNFANYGGFNHNLWIGLTNVPPSTTYIWSSGLTNFTYVNWLTGQPLNPDSLHNYTGILGETNIAAGLWVLADTNGFVANSIATNKFYGVVEVNTIQTNGVQFWISVTNTPNSTNAAFVSSNGCLYANIVDTNFVSHEIFSAAGLLQSNVYQHVALTYDTNSGIARLYLDGTNVATTNFGAAFVPKTDGDVLLGRDMGPYYTNNYYGGKMDEMSIYNRALSAAEIKTIYQVSAFASNGITGKFDPTVTPGLGLAEAEVTFGTTSNLIFGLNNEWEQNSYTFTATNTSMPFQITGLQPGILLDNFAISEAPLTNLYYLPEQTLDSLTGTSAGGNWSLQMWDNLNNAAVTNLSQLLSWQLSFVLESNSPTAGSLLPETPLNGYVAPGQTAYYYVPVPSWAHFATNILVSSTVPVDLLFNPTNLPTGTAPGDLTLLIASTGGAATTIISVNTNMPFSALNQAAQSYYVGVRNPGTTPASIVLQVDYDITTLTNNVPYNSSFNTNDSVRYYSFNVSSNAYEATFQILKLSGGNADLVVSKGIPLPTLTNSAYGSFNVSNLDETIYVLTNSSPVPLSAGTWYLGVIKRDTNAMTYSIVAKELDYSAGPITNSITIIPLTNGVPFNYTATPGAALTNFFVFHPTNSTPTNLISGVRFEVYNLTGNGDLTVQTNALPLAPPFFQTSQNRGRQPELVLVYTNNVLTNLATDWYLGVPNNEVTNINYTIVASIETNSYFPAFPGAAGAGGGSVGGRFGTVRHVTTTADSGPGSLRNAVTTNNCTIVFDVSGTIKLASPLVITNSYLTIAGQTASGGGITVAGSMTTVTNAHDVVIRDVRFRQNIGGSGSASLQFMNASNVIADHVSASWSANNLLSVLSSTNVTVQWSIMADSLLDTNNPHGYGSLLRYGSGTISLHHNLYADNYNGSPRLGDNISLDFVNNVIYNWGIQPGFSSTNDDLLANPNGFTNQMNYVCNYLIAGPDTAFYATNLSITNIAFVGGTTNTWIFQTNNIIDNNHNGITGDGAFTQWAMFTNQYTRIEQPFPLLQVPTDEAFLAYEKVMDFAGVNSSFRDSVDTDLAYKIRAQTGRIISTPLSDMVAWWKGEGNANDSIGSNDGILNGGLTFDYGEVGQAFNFKNTSGYVDVPASSQLNIGTNTGITVEAWIKPNNLSAQTSIVGWGGGIIAASNSTVLEGPVVNPANGHYYYLLQSNTWTGSEAWANALGGHLVTINDAAENSWVLNTFSLLGGAYHSLWIGLYDPKNDANTNPTQHGTNFIWADGSSSTYRDWYSGEPNNGGSGSSREYWTYIFSADQSGLAGYWNDLPNLNNDTAGHTINGVVELSTTPGVQLWASMTWSGGGGLGCLYANVMDSTGGSHEFSSAPGLIQTNIYQHVGLTYDHTTGLAKLYCNGIVVASTNLGIFIPATTADVILGNNRGGVYSGGIDEVSLYGRPLTSGEIAAVYTAGHAGKFQTQPGLVFKDTDQDGIPDFWESTFGQSVTNANNNTLTTNVNLIGYTDLEEYNNWLAGPHMLTITNTPVGIDLMQIFGNTGNLGFVISNSVNGTVYLTNYLTNALGSVINTGPLSNSIAIFTPTNTTPPLSGYASFDVYVTNTQTVAYFGPVKVSVLISLVPITYFTNLNTNPPPVLNTNIPPLTNTELTLFTYTNSATDSNTTVGLTITYTLTAVVDTNAMIANGWSNALPYVNVTNPAPVINPTTGVITWTPSELQGPGVYILTTVATDNGVPPLSATNTIILTVNETNMAPFFLTNTPSLPSLPLQLQTNYTISALTTLTVVDTATDLDIPPNPLSYTLFVSPAITNAAISTNGIVTWMPTIAQAAGSYLFTVVVTDTNIYAPLNQNLSVTNTFLVNVLAVAAPYAFTEPATSVTGTSAQLNGMATPNGLATTTWFQYGTTTNYGNITPFVLAGNGANVVYTFGSINLTTNLPYHFRLIASNSVSVVYGFDQILGEANVVAWGPNYLGQIAVPPSLQTNLNVTAVAGAYEHSMALRKDGTVVVWGDNTSGQTNTPAGLNNVGAIAGGEYYSLALKNNGTVTAWGSDVIGTPTNVPVGLNNVITIAGGTYTALALKSNGTIAAWGFNVSGLTNVPIGLSNVVSVAGGTFHNLAIKNDGTVAGWGDNGSGQLNIPSNLTNVVAIAAGTVHSLALKADGTVIAWGDDGDGQIDVPTNLNNVVAITAGGFSSVALKADGTLVSWGDTTAGQTVPAGIHNVMAVSAGYLHTLALVPFTFTNTVILDITNGLAQTNSVFPGSTVFYRVNVPTNVDFTTNILFFATNGAVNVWYSTNVPPTIGATNDAFLFSSTNGSKVLSIGGTPPLVPGSTYYLGINNTNGFAVNYGVEVDFHFMATNTTPQTNTIPISTVTYTNGGFLLTWFAPSNDLFMVQFTDTLFPATWQTFSNIVSYNPIAYTNNPASAQFNFFDNGSQYPFMSGRYYRLILLGAPSTNNTPPVLLAQTNRIINPLSQLIVTNIATDVDFPPQILTYTLSSTVTGTNQPVITNGIITWIPDLSQAGTSNVITTVVTDSGTPNMKATNSFSVIVTPLANLSSVVYTNGNFLLTWFAPSNELFQVQFTDTLFPANWLAFSNIVSFNPAFAASATATNAQFNFLDNGTQYPFTSGRYYRLILLGSGSIVPSTNNTPPVLLNQTNRVVNPLSQLSVTNIATDSDIPVQTLTYVLTSSVTGTNQPVITNGIITWTPDLSQAGTSNRITTVVTDSGTPSLKATNSFSVIVTPLAGLSSVVYTNGNFLLTWFAPSNELFQVQFTDTLVPANWLSFSNIVSFNPAFTASATATNAQFNFLDNGTQYPFASGRYYRLVLLGSGSIMPSTNAPPVLPSQPARIANPLNPLTVTNTATDALGHTLSYTLANTLTGTNLPVINPTNGIIIWTPSLSQGGTSNFITTIVTDTSVPNLRATNSFAVIANPVPALNNVTYTNGTFLLTWLAPTNDIFQVQFSDSLSPINWQGFTNGNHVTYTGPLTATNGLFTFTDNGVEHPFTGFRFYQINLIGINSLTSPSPMVATNAIAISNISTNGTFKLTWLGSTSQQFQVQWATNFVPPINWTPFPNIITSTNGSFIFVDTNATMGMKFYELLLLP